MPRRTFALIASIVVGLTALAFAQQPVFRGGVDLIRVDVRVVADDGRPVTDLTDEEFEVKVNGKPSPVRTLQFLKLDVTGTDAPASEAARFRDVSTNQTSIRGRLTVIVIDQSDLPEDVRPLMNGLSRFMKTFGPEDQTALVTLPRPGIWHDFTRDTGEIQGLLMRASALPGSDEPAPLIGGTNADGSSVVGSGDVAVDRGEPTDYRQGMQQVPSWMANEVGDGRQDLMYALEALARRLKTVAGPKTLILISTHLPPGVGIADYRAFAEEAAAARLTVYVIKPHDMLGSASGSQSGITAPFEEAGGVDFLAGLTGGVVLNAVANADGVFARIGRETSGTYVLGVEPPAGIPHNKPLDVSVSVKRQGLTVRSPKQLVAAETAKPSKNVKGDVGNVLHDPRLASDVGLKVTAYNAMSAEANHVKTVIVAQLDAPPDAKGISWGFEVHDGDRIVADAYEKAAAKDPDTTGEVVTSANLPPGSYVIRFATVDARGHRASVDHTLTVGLHDAPNLQFSDVFVGEAVSGHFKPRISVDAAATQLVSIVELYSTGIAAFNGLSVEFALRAADGTSRAAARARVQSAAGGAKGLAQVALPLAHLTPGVYEVVAVVLNGRQPIGETRREVIIGQER